MIHSRKLNIKAIVTFYAVVDETTGIQIPVALEEEDISVKKKRVGLMSLCIHKKDTLRIKEDIELAANRPNVESLLWHTIEPRNLDLRVEKDKIRVKGELAVFILYEGTDEEALPQWQEYTLSGVWGGADPPYRGFPDPSGDGSKTGWRRGGEDFSGRCCTGAEYEAVPGGGV